jgi:hypothetical protein
MKQIKDIPLFVGSKEEYITARQRGMKIVCCLNRANGFVSHQSVVGWKGRGCDPTHPHYLFKRDEDAIYLNMIDAEDPRYISHEMVNAALKFIHENIQSGSEVFVYCSLGESRSPSIALMYLLESKLIEASPDAFRVFKNEYYINYKPKRGNFLYIKRRWGI